MPSQKGFLVSVPILNLQDSIRVVLNAWAVGWVPSPATLELLPVKIVKFKVQSQVVEGKQPPHYSPTETAQAHQKLSHRPRLDGELQN
eukprot:654823-Amphidinium_carterae.1